MAVHAEALLQSEELTAALEARAFAYRLLMQAFLAEPDRAAVRALAASGAAGLFPFADDSDLIRQGLADVQSYLKDAANATDEAFEHLHWDYTRMFIGPDTLPAPPWESAYCNEERLLFQEQTTAVRRAFRSYGFASAWGPGEPDDHIGLELDFLYRTCGLALERANAGDGPGLVRILRDQQTFLREHLLVWAPAFAADVVKSAGTGFYRGLARMLEGYLEIDRRLLEELLSA